MTEKKEVNKETLRCGLNINAKVFEPIRQNQSPLTLLQSVVKDKRINNNTCNKLDKYLDVATQRKILENKDISLIHNTINNVYFNENEINGIETLIMIYHQRKSMDLTDINKWTVSDLISEIIHRSTEIDGRLNVNEPCYWIKLDLFKMRIFDAVKAIEDIAFLVPRSIINEIINVSMKQHTNQKGEHLKEMKPNENDTKYDGDEFWTDIADIIDSINKQKGKEKLPKERIIKCLKAYNYNKNNFVQKKSNFIKLLRNKLKVKIAGAAILWTAVHKKYFQDKEGIKCDTKESVELPSNNTNLSNADTNTAGMNSLAMIDEEKEKEFDDNEAKIYGHYKLIHDHDDEKKDANDNNIDIERSWNKTKNEVIAAQNEDAPIESYNDDDDDDDIDHVDEVLIDNLSSEIEKHYISTRTDSNSLKKRLCQHVIDCIKCLEKDMNANHINYGKTRKYTSKWDIFRFGSESYGTSSRDSDIDIGIFLNFKNGRYDKRNILKQLADIISKNDNDWSLIIKRILTAKYPIIRIIEYKYNIQIDVSIADRYCKQRDKCIREIIDEFEKKRKIPIKPLIVFIKYWSKQKRINNSYQGYLNSFGYTLLVIKFLKYHIKHSSNYKLLVLVYKFFEFYAKKYKPEIHAISIDTHSDTIFDKKHINNNCMQINDPINLQNNVAEGVGAEQCKHIQQEVINEYRLIKQCIQNNKNLKQSIFNLLVQNKQDMISSITTNTKTPNRYRDMKTISGFIRNIIKNNNNFSNLTRNEIVSLCCSYYVSFIECKDERDGSIYISPECTQMAMSNSAIYEYFKTSQQFFYHSRWTAKMQQFDGLFKVFCNFDGKISIYNLEINDRNIDGETLYMVGVPNNKIRTEKLKKNKKKIEKWKSIAFMTATQIYTKYGIKTSDLPLGSRANCAEYKKRELIISGFIRNITKNGDNIPKSIWNWVFSYYDVSWNETCIKSIIDNVSPDDYSKFKVIETDPMKKKHKIKPNEMELTSTEFREYVYKAIKENQFMRGIHIDQERCKWRGQIMLRIKLPNNNWMALIYDPHTERISLDIDCLDIKSKVKLFDPASTIYQNDWFNNNITKLSITKKSKSKKNKQMAKQRGFRCYHYHPSKIQPFTSNTNGVNAYRSQRQKDKSTDTKRLFQGTISNYARCNSEGIITMNKSGKQKRFQKSEFKPTDHRKLREYSQTQFYIYNNHAVDIQPIHGLYRGQISWFNHSKKCGQIDCYDLKTRIFVLESNFDPSVNIRNIRKGVHVTFDITKNRERGRQHQDIAINVTTDKMMYNKQF